MAYFTIQTRDGYSGKYATKGDAEHARRVMFGNRAMAHPIIRVVQATKEQRDTNRKEQK